MPSILKKYKADLPLLVQKLRAKYLDEPDPATAKESLPEVS